ncbi:MAG: LysM peptidoglycan-binding domain-containing protein [Caldilineaceae bacterium]|nr:LysM peptidoglycan-binding domain-containing protein [Caldilineaceae bacterium]
MRGKIATRGLGVLLGLVVAASMGAALFLVQPLAAQDNDATSTATPAEEGYDYTVQSGDSWGLIAQRAGISVAELQAANPQAVRANDWIIVGETLYIPGAQEALRDVHIVGAGESWNSIAAFYNLRASDLREANPALVRPGLYLYRGDRIVIPNPAEETEDAAATPASTVDATGEATTAPAEEATEEATEEAIEEATEEPTKAPTVDPTETPEPTAVPTEEPTPEPTSTPTATDAPTETPTEEPTAEPTVELTEEPTEESTAAPEEEPTGGSDLPASYIVGPGESWNSIAYDLDIDPVDLQAANPDLIRPGLYLHVGDELVIPQPGQVTPADEQGGDEAATEGDAAEAVASGCPAEIGGYAEIASQLLATGDLAGLSARLDECGASRDDSVTQADWTGDGLDDLLLIYNDPAFEGTVAASDLLIFNGTNEGYESAYHARPAGEVRLLATEDINADQQPDIVWTDTTCGASTCFDNIYIRSWTGEEWADWVDGSITMAYAEINLQASGPESQGQDISLRGGVYGSVGAGPQRNRTELWGSIDGAPYAKLAEAFEENSCLYFTVLDANSAFAEGTEEGMVRAEELYTDAIGNEELTQCWVRPDEMTELRSFSYFRLAQLSAYQGIPEVTETFIQSLEAEYPDSVYADVGRRWYDVYAAENDVAAACDVITEYTEENPAVTEVLSDYGYANPTFTTDDLCPALQLAQPAGDTPDDDTADADAADTATEGNEAAPDAAADGATGDDASPAETDAETGDSDAAEAVGAEADTEADSGAEAPAAPAATPNPLGACPEDLAGYAAAFPAVISRAAGDAAAVEQWMRDCRAMSDERGALILTELNGDSLEDAVVFPTIVSDIGFGPDGSQGAVLIYHADASGALQLVYNPDVYGQPMPLKVDDLNDDGRPEIAWTVESCSISCVLEVQMVSWVSDVYTSTIEPGALIAQGTAGFAPVGPVDPGSGQELVLEGGVSAAPESGLAVPHTERWQSIAGAPFRRLDWLYDRESEGNDCLGLRLVEADISLQAADVLGYGPAIDRYAAALSEPLAACSIFGMAAEDELVLLRGLANFRLIQAQALSGDADAAQAALDELAQEQPNGPYTEAAQQWLAAYAADGDPGAACDAVQPIFDEDDNLWLITDQFGFNHPALAAHQLCYRPVQ